MFFGLSLSISLFFFLCPPALRLVSRMVGMLRFCNTLGTQRERKKGEKRDLETQLVPREKCKRQKPRWREIELVVSGYLWWWRWWRARSSIATQARRADYWARAWSMLALVFSRECLAVGCEAEVDCQLSLSTWRTYARDWNELERLSPLLTNYRVTLLGVLC